MQSEPSRTSKMELFAKIAHGKPLTIFAQSPILDVQLGSELPFEIRMFSLPSPKIEKPLTHENSLCHIKHNFTIFIIFLTGVTRQNKLVSLF